MKTFTIVLVSGERYQVEKESKEKVLSWINTGAAGFLPIRGRDLVRITPNNVKEIIEWVMKRKKLNSQQLTLKFTFSSNLYKN